jgi:hypothetical protein
MMWMMYQEHPKFQVLLHLPKHHDEWTIWMTWVHWVIWGMLWQVIRFFDIPLIRQREVAKLMYLLHIDFSLVHTPNTTGTLNGWGGYVYTELPFGPPVSSLGKDKF